MGNTHEKRWVEGAEGQFEEHNSLTNKWMNWENFENIKAGAKRQVNPIKFYETSELAWGLWKFKLVIITSEYIICYDDIHHGFKDDCGNY